MTIRKLQVRFPLAPTSMTLEVGWSRTAISLSLNFRTISRFRRLGRQQTIRLSLSQRHRITTHWMYFYRAMHFSAKRGIAIACRLSVCLSVCDVGELW